MPESRSQFLQSLHQLDAFPNTPFGKPSLELKFLGHDVFYSMQMLASLEMPTMVCDQLSVLQAASLYDTVRNSRESYAQTASNETFTASDVQQTLRDFASSSENTKKWLMQMLRVPGAQQNDAEHSRLIPQHILPQFASSIHKYIIKSAKQPRKC